MTAEAQALAALLAEECRALRCGQYDGLARIAAEKARLVQAIAALPPPEADLAALRDTLRRNARLIASAVAAFRAADRRVAELRQAAAGFSSYAADGSSALIAAGPVPGFERRA